jgi:hypothetical protein
MLSNLTLKQELSLMGLVNWLFYNLHFIKLFINILEIWNISFTPPVLHNILLASGMCKEKLADLSAVIY